MKVKTKQYITACYVERSLHDSKRNSIKVWV